MPVPLYVVDEDGKPVPWDGKVEVVDKLRPEPGGMRKIVSAVNWAQVAVVLLLLAILVSIWAR